MVMSKSRRQVLSEGEVDKFRQALGPFVVAAEVTRMPMIFTNAIETGRPIIFANDSFLALTGYERIDVIGESFELLMCGVTDRASLQLMKNQFEESTETVDMECLRKGGGRLWVALSIHPVLDADDRIVQHCISFVDLSPQMKRMRRERDALHALYQHTPDFIAITEGAKHRFTFGNVAFQDMVGGRDLLGREVVEAIPELAGQQFVALMDTVYETGKPFLGKAIAVKLQREIGSDLVLRYLDFLYQPMRSDDGQVTGLFCEGHDVTEQRLASEQVLTLQNELIHLSRVSAMGTMAATLAHELAQPLTAISNYAAVCNHLNEKADGKSAGMTETLAAISGSARRGGEIIRRLRNMSKRNAAQHEWFDVREAVREAIALVQVGACASVSIQDLSPGGVYLKAGRIQIQQIIMNLLRNACEAVADCKGHVTVTTGMEAGRILISIGDNGPGVSPEAAKTLFAWSESSKPEGMGIGLSICQTIAEAHGGKLWLERSGDEGSCFTLSLPIDTSTPAISAIAGASEVFAFNEHSQKWLEIDA